MHDWRRNQAALMVASFVGFTGFTLVMPFLALRFQGLGVHDTRSVALWTGFTLGVTPAVAAACAPLWGRVGDRFGNKLLVQRSLFFCVFVMTLMGLATEPWQLFVLRALQGLFAGYGPLTIAMAAASAPREKMAHAIGLVQTSQRVAPAVGPVVGGLLAQAIGLRNSFFVAGAVYGLAFALVSVLYRETGHAARDADARLHVPMREILSIRNLLLLMGVIFGLQLTERSLGPVLLLHVEALGFARAAVLVGVLFSLLSVAGALGHQIAASALARAPASRVITTAIVAAAIGLAWFTVSTAGWALMAGILAVGIGVGVAMTAAFTAAGASVPRHVHSTSFGFLTGASLTGTAVGPVLGGLVAARSITGVFVLGVVILTGLAVVVRRVMADSEPGGLVSQVAQVGQWVRWATTRDVAGRIAANIRSFHSMTDSRTSTPVTERAALVGVVTGSARRAAAEVSLAELAGLADAAGATVVLTTMQERARPDPTTFIGRGKVQSLAAACAEADVDVVICDNELSPAQLRHLEDELKCKVLDRTRLILDIFARRARTREGKRQVELAQLKYLLPRLAGSGTALSRLGGGIGTRGPGETKLETNRRRIRTRIDALQREIDQVRQRRSQLRERREKRAVPTVALVGYTNAGKTTLFNRLTGERAVASDALFVTLDPLVRQIRLPDARELLLSDTVGFINRLPHALVAAFRATLEEVVEAELILHVVDAANPEWERQVAAVERVLEEVGATEAPIVSVFNKVDVISDDERRRLRDAHEESAFISARTGDGVGALLNRITEALGLDTRRVTVSFDSDSADDRQRMARLYRLGRVVSHVTSDGRSVIEADVPRRLVDRVVPHAAVRGAR